MRVDLGVRRIIIHPALALGLHNYLSWAGLVMGTLHALVLLGDNNPTMNLAGIVIPFVGPYRPMWVGLGVVGIYLMLLVSVSFYVRSRIGQKNFRLIHYTSYAAFL